MKKHLTTLLTTLLAVTAMATATHATPKAKPDVLFIAIDDMNDWTTLFDKNNPIKTSWRSLEQRGHFKLCLLFTTVMDEL